MTTVEERKDIAKEVETALFKEAHQRRRRRRRRFLIGVTVGAALLALLLSVLGVDLWASPSGTRHPKASSQGAPANVITAGPTLAWVDYSGALHIGSLNRMSQRVVVPKANADPTAPLVWVGSTVFWVHSLSRTRPPEVGVPAPRPTVQGFDVATGTPFAVGHGYQVFPSLSRSFLYVGTDPRHIAKYWLRSHTMGAPVQVPDGWSLADPQDQVDSAVAGGIVVFSTQEQPGSQPSTFGVWHLATNSVDAIGQVWRVIDTYTEPGAQRSTIAWFPRSCVSTTGLGPCPLALTNSATGVTRLVAAPASEPFAFAGAFSPNGSQLAVFVQVGQKTYAGPGYSETQPAVQLAIVDTASGALRLMPNVVIAVGEPTAWATWLPGDVRVLVGGNGVDVRAYVDNHYIVDARTGTVQPFGFIEDQDLDVNYSVALRGAS